MENACSDMGTTSSKDILPLSIASNTSSIVITLVIEAMGIGTSAFLAYSTCPVVSSISNAPLQGRSKLVWSAVLSTKLSLLTMAAAETGSVGVYISAATSSVSSHTYRSSAYTTGTKTDHTTTAQTNTIILFFIIYHLVLYFVYVYVEQVGNIIFVQIVEIGRNI